MRRHPLAQMILLGVLASIVGTAIVLIMDWMPEQGATAAGPIDTLYDVLLIASVPIFVLVMAVAIYSVVAFRAKPGDMGDGAPIHGNTRLEVFWVTIPFLIVSALAIYGWIVLDDIEAKKPGQMIVKVKGQQFTWTFDYPQQRVKSSELILPKDKPVEFQITTNDVIHSFWVPEFRLKSDAVPGLTTKVRVTPNRIGEWNVVCAELCGIGHATMRQEVRVMEQAAFQAWVERKRAGGGARQGAAGGAPDGKAIFTDTGCGACHTLADAGSSAKVGPGLDDLSRVAAERRPGSSAEEYVRQSILDPRSFTVKGFQDVMPTTYKDDLAAEDVDALVKYLLGAGENP